MFNIQTCTRCTYLRRCRIMSCFSRRSFMCNMRRCSTWFCSMPSHDTSTSADTRSPGRCLRGFLTVQGHQWTSTCQSHKDTSGHQHVSHTRTQVDIIVSLTQGHKWTSSFHSHKDTSAHHCFTHTRTQVDIIFHSHKDTSGHHHFTHTRTHMDIIFHSHKDTH